MMIQSYYGTGKGKTTAAVGAAIRCSGSGQNVLFVQFLKNGDSSEIEVLKNLESINLLFPKEHYEMFDNLKEKRTEELSKSYNNLLFEEIPVNIGSYQMIVLDEVLDAIEFGYVDKEAFAAFLNKWKQCTEIVMTGHTLSDEIAAVSDYVSEIKAVKHPYNSGVSSRKGIEY